MLGDNADIAVHEDVHGNGWGRGVCTWELTQGTGFGHGNADGHGHLEGINPRDIGSGEITLDGDGAGHCDEHG